MSRPDGRLPRTLALVMASGALLVAVWRTLAAQRVPLGPVAVPASHKGMVRHTHACDVYEVYDAAAIQRDYVVYEVWRRRGERCALDLQ